MIGYMFSHAFRWLQVFPRFSLVTCFAALFSGYVFSRFPLVTSFPAIFTGYKFSRALSTGYKFSRAPFTGYKFSSAFHWLHVYLRWSTVLCCPPLPLVTLYCLSFDCFSVCKFNLQQLLSYLASQTLILDV